MQNLMNECPHVTGFGPCCGHRTVKAGERSHSKLTANLLLYCESAEIAVKTESDEISLLTGSILFLPSDTDASFSVFRDGGVTVISYQSSDTDKLRTTVSLTTTTPKRTKQAFFQFASSCEEQKPLREFAMLSSFYTVLYLLARNSKSGNRIFLKQHTLHEARLYLERHFADPNLRITDAAAKAGISPTYLRRLFMDVEGCTPIQYITDLRIRHANELIKSGTLSMEKIAHACGLSDVNYLKKLLKSSESTEKKQT